MSTYLISPLLTLPYVHNYNRIIIDIWDIVLGKTELYQCFPVSLGGHLSVQKDTSGRTGNCPSDIYACTIKPMWCALRHECNLDFWNVRHEYEHNGVFLPWWTGPLKGKTGWGTRRGAIEWQNWATWEWTHCSVQWKAMLSKISKK